MSATDLLKAVTVTAELTTTPLSDLAKAAMVEALMPHPERAVTAALIRCQKEVAPGRFALSAVMDRLEDGRPSSDEAWAIALNALDEAETVIWCDEIAKAFEVARPILEARDKIGARMAFREAYDRLCREARSANVPAKWIASAGWDRDRREVALSNAVVAGYLSQGDAAKLLPAPKDAGPLGRLLLGAPVVDGEKISPDIVQRCAELRAMLAESAARREKEREEAKAREREDLQRRKDEAAALVKSKAAA